MSVVGYPDARRMNSLLTEICKERGWCIGGAENRTQVRQAVDSGADAVVDTLIRVEMQMDPVMLDNETRRVATRQGGRLAIRPSRSGCLVGASALRHDQARRSRVSLLRLSESEGTADFATAPWPKESSARAPEVRCATKPSGSTGFRVGGASQSLSSRGTAAPRHSARSDRSGSWPFSFGWVRSAPTHVRSGGRATPIRRGRT